MIVDPKCLFGREAQRRSVNYPHQLPFRSYCVSLASTLSVYFYVRIPMYLVLHDLSISIKPSVQLNIY